MIVTENLERVCGVYAAIHRDTLRCYVGSSFNIGSRRRDHIRSAKNGRQCFARALREYGSDAFDLELIEKCDKDTLRDREEFWINFYDSVSVNGFNTFKKTAWPNPDYKISEATRARISAAGIGRKTGPFTEEHRNKLSIAAKNRGFSINAIQAMKKSNTGKAKSLETRLKMSQAQKGRKLSDEAKKKLSMANLGKKLSKETIAKRTATLISRNYHRSDSAKAAIGAANKIKNTGKKQSPETIAKRMATIKANGGYKHSPEMLKKLSDFQRNK